MTRMYHLSNRIEEDNVFTRIIATKKFERSIIKSFTFDLNEQHCVHI